MSFLTEPLTENQNSGVALSTLIYPVIGYCGVRAFTCLNPTAGITFGLGMFVIHHASFDNEQMQKRKEAAENRDKRRNLALHLFSAGFGYAVSTAGMAYLNGGKIALTIAASWLATAAIVFAVAAITFYCCLRRTENVDGGAAAAAATAANAPTGQLPLPVSTPLNIRAAAAGGSSLPVAPPVGSSVSAHKSARAKLDI